MKVIRRFCKDSGKYELFTATGIWENKHLAYGKVIVKDNAEVVIEEEGEYYQLLTDKGMVMFHI